jgi:pyridoxamine 5'-phosphate oxidase-like protein
VSVSHRRPETAVDLCGNPLLIVEPSHSDATDWPRLNIRVISAAVPSWSAFEQAEPEFAGRVRRLFDAGRHKTIATLRADGSPRVSGIECEFADGELRFGSMTSARKGADLKRDPRFALHGPTFHPENGKESEWPGEAKIAGRAILADPVAADEANEEPDGETFVADITQVVVTGLDAEATKLVVEFWTPEHGLRRVERV